MTAASTRSGAWGRDQAPDADEHAARVQAEIEARVAHFARHPDGIDARLAELEAEWDVERVREANAVLVSLVGAGLAAFARRRWLAMGLPAAAALFLLHRAVTGFEPPHGLLRRLGFRTAGEIERERQALRALRGEATAGDREPRPSLAEIIARRGLQALRR